MSISKKSYLAIAKETTPYTPATTASQYIPTKSIVKGGWKPIYMDEERGDRNANYDAVLTTREGDGDPKGPWYNDTSGYFLFGFMGADAVSQPDAAHVPTVYKHTLTFADNPPTFTLFKSYDAVVHQMAGTAVEKVVLKFAADAKLLECEATVKGLYPTVYGGAPLTPAFSTVKPIPGYAPTIVMTNGASSDITEWTLTLEQKITPWYGASGSPDFVRWDFGERKATLEFSARFDVPANIYDVWRLGNRDTCHITFQGALIANSGGSGVPPNTNYFQTLDINIGTLVYDQVEPKLDKDNVMLHAKCTVIPTSGAMFTSYIQNTLAAYN